MEGCMQVAEAIPKVTFRRQTLPFWPTHLTDPTALAQLLHLLSFELGQVSSSQGWKETLWELGKLQGIIPTTWPYDPVRVEYIHITPAGPAYVEGVPRPTKATRDVLLNPAAAHGAKVHEDIVVPSIRFVLYMINPSERIYTSECIYAISSAIWAYVRSLLSDRSYRLRPSCRPMEIPAKASSVVKSSKSSAAVWKMLCMKGT